MLQAVKNSEASTLKLITEKDLLQVEWGDGSRSQFHYLWLRDNCPSIPRLNAQRNIDPLTILAEPYPQKVSVNEEGKIQIVWANDGHVSKFDSAWLRQHDYYHGRKPKFWEPKLWGSEKGALLAKADYNEILQDEGKLKDWLLSLRDDGIAVLENVPTQPDTILELASQFGCLQEIPWGKFANIKTVENPNGYAFTNARLFPHTDFAYLQAPPAYLLFHYLKVTPIGGENTLVDGFKIAEVLRQKEPEKFKLLSTFPLQFCFQCPDTDLTAEGEIIHLDCLGKVKSIRFSCRSMQPFNFPPEVMKPYYEAYRAFAEMCNSDEYQIRVKFNSGDLAIADNHRVLHGRTEYAGERWMQSAYIERTKLLGRLYALSR